MPVRGRLLWCCSVVLGAAAVGCASGGEIVTQSTAVTTPAVTAERSATSAPASTTPASAATVAPSSTSTTTSSPAPTTTAAPALADLEVVEWSEYPYANLADPSNKDTRVEVLLRNPNDAPVRLDNDSFEVRFVDAVGEVVYANPNPTLFVWQGEWVKGGETFPISACVCFDSSGLPRQEWQTIDVAASLQPAGVIDYTDQVDFILGEWFRLSDRHLGGDSLGADFEVVNTSNEVLSNFEVRVTARDAAGRYVGVAVWGSMSDRSSPTIAPGASASGVLPTMIDYFDGPLTYTPEALGIVQH